MQRLITTDFDLRLCPSCGSPFVCDPEMAKQPCSYCDPDSSVPTKFRLMVRSLMMNTGRAYALWVEGLTRKQTVTLLHDPGSIVGRLGLGPEVTSVEYLILNNGERPLMLLAREDAARQVYALRVAGLNRRQMHGLLRTLGKALGQEWLPKGESEDN